MLRSKHYVRRRKILFYWEVVNVVLDTITAGTETKQPTSQELVVLQFLSLCTYHGTVAPEVSETICRVASCRARCVASTLPSNICKHLIKINEVGIIEELKQ